MNIEAVRQFWHDWLVGLRGIAFLVVAAACVSLVMAAFILAVGALSLLATAPATVQGVIIGGFLVVFAPWSFGQVLKEDD